MQHTNNTHHTKTHTTLKQNTAHKTTQQVRDTLHKMNARQIRFTTTTKTITATSK
jgi:hypothetical protein